MSIIDVNLKFYPKLLHTRTLGGANFDFKILPFLGFGILKFAAANLNFKSRRADMKHLATAQAEEVTADLACRVSTLVERFHTLKVDAQSTEVVVHSD